ncbi:MAG: response regulator transcription factor [Armatimonadetes bacterium]|nr:response regulator transcription factor [Armatimonadota bacterium]
MRSPRLLVIEDQEELRELFVRRFCEEGYEVTAAESGAAALRAFRRTLADVVLLDLGLPDLGGMSVLDELRRMGGAPVIVVTDDISPVTAARALDEGAADCIRKPVALVELCARVRAVLRTAEPVGAQDLIVVGPLTIDTAVGLAQYAGRNVGASSTEVRVLGTLARRAGTVLSKDQLVEAIWSGERTSHLVEVHVSNIRRKLRSAGCQQDLIKTVPGRGYRLRNLGA